MKEALLRPAVEINSAVVFSGLSALAFFAPSQLILKPEAGIIAGLISGGYGLYRGLQAFNVLKYQHGLKYYKYSAIAPSQIPKDKDDGGLYLGDGFDWEQKHSQRKYDAKSNFAKDYVTPGTWITPMKRWVKKLKSTQRFNPLTNFLSTNYWWNPLAQPDLGGNPIIHGVGSADEKPIFLGQKHRVGHTLILGTTRVGKTRLMELLVTQDIHDNNVVIVIDPKGDAELMMRVYAEASRAGRLGELRLFHLGYPEISCRYNGVGNFSRITEVATRATNGLPDGGNAAAFKQFAWRFTNLVSQAQVALGTVPTYERLLRDLMNIEPIYMGYSKLVLLNNGIKDWENRLLEIQEKNKDPKKVQKSMQDRGGDLLAMVQLQGQIQQELKLEDPLWEGLLAAVKYEKSFFEKIIASLGPHLEKLTSGEIGKILSPNYFDQNDTRPLLDWMQVIRQGGIVYVGLDALSDSVVGGVVGNSMLADLVSVGGKLYKTGLDPHNPSGKITLPKVACHFDEVNELMGPEFVPMVNKIGGAGFMVHAYTQTLPDIEAKMGSRAKAEQVLGNFNNVIMLRVKSKQTADFFSSQLPEVSIETVESRSSVTDGLNGDTHFVSSNSDVIARHRVPMIDAADLMELPQGQAFCLIEGNRLKKIRIPLPDNTNDVHVPESIRDVAHKMQSKYNTKIDWEPEHDWLADQPIFDDENSVTLKKESDE